MSQTAKPTDAKTGSSPDPQTTEKTEELGADQVQEIVDKEQEQGFAGIKVDPTPNENYTLAGVTKKAPTPETDPEQAKLAGSSKFGPVPVPTERGKE